MNGATSGLAFAWRPYEPPVAALDHRLLAGLVFKPA
jgi:hypothetical protein